MYAVRSFLILISLIVCSCIMPRGERVLIKADGIIDKNEEGILVSLAERDAILEQYSVPFYYIQNHISDMSIFIRKNVYPKWPGIYGLHLKIVNNVKEFKKEWEYCRITLRSHSQVMSENTVGFYCPFNYSIILFKNNIKQTLDYYDHEEGHHIHPLNGETSEFPAEFNRLWKIFIRMAMNKEVGEAYFDFLHSYRPRDQNTRTIKVIGKYRSAVLMFFMVMNHFRADLTKSAEFMFESSAKTLKWFFYSGLKKYPRNLTVREIWEKEMFKMFNDGYLYKNVITLRKKTRKLN